MRRETDLASTWERRGRAGRTKTVTMNRPATRTSSGVPRRITRSLSAFALVFVASACAGSSSQAPSTGPDQSLDLSTGDVARTAPSASTTPPPRPTYPSPAVSSGRPIRLVGDPGVTPAELERAERLLESTIAGLERFRSPSQAYAAGYRSIGDTASIDEHYVNWSYIDDGHILDPMRPESVVYEHRDGQQIAVAAMYSLPFGSSFGDVPDVGGSLTQWHVHSDLCLTDNPQQKVILRVTTPDGPCPQGTSKASNTPMLHVWIVPNRCGPFAALEHGGQFPAGQTRHCDTKNSSVP